MAGPGLCYGASALGHSVTQCGGKWPIDDWDTSDEMSGVWGQIMVIILSPVMAIAAAIMSLLIVKGNSKIVRFQMIYMAICAVITLILMSVEFYYGIGFIGDRFNSLSHGVLGQLENRLGASGSVHVRGWIAAAVFLLLSAILFAADALLIFCKGASSLSRGF
ncbi:hypothetical protein L596_028836 [Steinernema carpocapsae]|nr:hypothetical protein L596_028836 [Steinernema carpocapsae]